MKMIKLFYALGLAALLAGCSNILNAPEGPAPKTGTVILTVDQGSGARTVFPSYSQFTRVSLSFSGSPTLDDVEVTDGAVAINLPVGGPWTVTANAYRDDILAAHSTAAHTLSWSGNGPVAVTGGTRFVLEPTGIGDGTLRGAVVPPEGITLGEGSRITIIKLSDQSVALEQDLSEGEGEDIGGDMPLPAGRYSVAVVLVDDETGYTAVYHRTVAILSGLMTEIRFEPDDVDFLSEEARAAMTSVENLKFDLTEVPATGISMDGEDFVNGNIAIAAPNGTAVVYFTVYNPEALTLTPSPAALCELVSDAEGSSSDASNSVFKVDAASAAGKDGGSVEVRITAKEDAREEVPITVTVTVEPSRFGLFVDNEGALERVADPIADMSAAFAWLQTNAATDTSYVIQIDKDYVLTPSYASKTGVSNVTITLRGYLEERVVTFGGAAPANNGHIYIANGTTFVLGENITLDGTGSTRSPVYVYNGKFVMKPKSKITKMIRPVYITGPDADSKGSFIMEGGSISGNESIVSGNQTQGEGMVFCLYGAVVMEDGEINNNITAQDSAAVYIPRRGDFIMRGGSISGNTRGVYLGNAGATFTMEDGEISYNGLSTNAGPFEPGTIYGNTSASYVIHGGGVYLSSTSAAGSDPNIAPVFTMTGGKIINNQPNDAFSSGIYQREGYTRVILNGEVEISGNSINAFVRTATLDRANITVGEHFKNIGADPITVDIVSASSSNSATLLTYFKTDPAVPIVSDVAKLGSFRTGKALYGGNGSFRIFSNSYTIDPETGIPENIP
jgi:hypothetical protein